MYPIRRLPLLVLPALPLLSLALPAAAEDPFACVADDIRDAFLAPYGSGDTVYSTSPAPAFESLNLSRDFAVVGSATAANSSQTVYKSTRTPASAVNSLAQRMRESGWTSRNQPYQASGFQSSQTPVIAMLCERESGTSLTINSFTRDGATFVSLSERPDPQQCARASTMAMRVTDMVGGFSLPLLTVPDEPGVVVTTTGTSMGGGRQSSGANISGYSSRQSLKDLLDAQISDQGWNREGSWEGSASSGSSWVKELDDGGVVAATLNLVSGQESVISATFHATRADATQNMQTLMSVSGGGQD